MRNFLWFFTAIALVAIPMAAEAQFPKPRPTAPAVQETAPAPAPAVAVPVPTVNVSPQVSLPPASTMDEIKSWLNTMFAGLIAGLLAKIGFSPAATRVVPVDASASSGGDPLGGVISKIKDPATRAVLDSLILRGAESPLIRGAVTTGLGAVPVAGGLLAQLEPGINALVKKALADNLPPSAQP